MTMEGTELLQKLLQCKKNELSFRDKILRFVLSCESKNRFFPVGDSANLLNELLQYGCEHSLRKSSESSKYYFRARVHNKFRIMTSQSP